MEQESGKSIDGLKVSQVEPAYKKDGYYTVEDWFSWGDGFRAELHDGMLVKE